MRIPSLQTKKWRVSYTGKFFGDIIRAFNLDLFSDKGRVKTGGKIYPHTTSIEPIIAFTKASILDTTRKTKLWGVSSKVYASESDGDFTEITDTGFGTGEETGTNSDILSTGDDAEELEKTSVSITGTEYAFDLGKDANYLKVAQAFNIAYPINELKIDLSKVGSPDDLTISIQADNSGVPSGTDVATKTFTHEELTTTLREYTITDFATENLKGDYWLVLTKGGTADAFNYYKFNYIRQTEDAYEDGELKRWDGSSWITYEETLLSTTSTEYTNGGEGELWGTTWTPAEINSANFGLTKVAGNLSSTPDTTYSIDFIKIKIYYTDGGKDLSTDYMLPTDNSTLSAPYDTPWTNPTNAQTDDGNFATSVNATAYHCWHDFNFAIPVTATITGIEVVMKAKIDTAEECYISGALTKDAGAISGVSKFFGAIPPIDIKLTINSSYPAADERVYLTTNKDVLFLSDEDDRWYSLWQGILEREELENYPAILKNLGAGGTLILGNDNLIHTFIATATSPTEGTFNKLIFDPNYFINWIRVTSSSVFIGLQNKLGELEPSQVVHYEPYAERTRIFTINEGATMGFIKDENCHIIDKLGQIRQFTGASFQPYLYFPCYYRDEILTTLPHRNGIIERGQIVKIAWEGQYPDPAGVWVIEDNNLYHKHSLVFDKTNLNSLGALEVESLGAIYEDDNLFIGGNLKDGASTDVKGAFSTIKTAVATDNRANFTTAKLISQEISDIWQDIVLKYDPAIGGTIKVKYKVEPNKVGITDEYTGIWTSSTTFTSTTAEFVSAVNNSNIEVGDEVIIRKGQGAGLLAHITEITGTTTKTITIDEGLTAITNGTFTFSVEKWKLVNFDINNNKFSSKASLKDEKLESTQLKVEINKHTLEEIQVSNVPNYSIKKI